MSRSGIVKQKKSNRWIFRYYGKPSVNLQNLCTAKGIDEEYFLFYRPFVLSNSILSTNGVRLVWCGANRLRWLDRLKGTKNFVKI